MSPTRAALFASTAFALAFASCAPSSHDGAAARRVPTIQAVATIHPVAQLLSEVGGERVSVSTLLPPGASPHAYEPIPSDLVRLARADLLVRVGGGIDSWARPLLAAGGNDPLEVALDVLDDAAAATSEPHAHEDHGHAHSPGTDPHVWLDPIFAAERAVPAFAAALIELDPGARPYYEARRDDLVSRLLDLHASIRAALAEIRAREYIAFHSAWGRFAARYDLHEAGVVEEAGGEEPTPREIAALIRAARASNIDAILVEPQMSSRIAEIIAAEFGGRTVLVDPLGDPADERRATYFGVMEFNARAFARALSGAAS